MCLSCTVTDIFSVEYWRDLKMWVRDRHCTKITPFDRSHTSSSSIVTVAVSCIVSEIKRDSGRKRPFLILPFNLNDQLESPELFPKILTQTAQGPYVAKYRYCSKVQPPR